MVSMRIEGGKELAETLNALSTRLRKKLLNEVLVDAAEPMRARASALAPREPGAPDIADNIVVSRMLSSMDDAGGLTRNDEYQATVKMGPAKGFPYGILQEYGTVHHGAQPFMRPAFDASAQQAIRSIGEALWRELAAKGIQRPTVDAPSAPSGPGRLT